MNVEQDKLRYTDAISDFGSIIIEHGARKVALDFVEFYPTQAYELVSVLGGVSKQTPALFKKQEM